jgi:chemotaxis protein CheD
MSNLVVGIGDCQVSKDPTHTIITYALGSCIALAIYDPVVKVGGLLHYLLPESKLDLEKAARNPFMFADTGIPALFHKVYALGAVKQRLCVVVAGGAQVTESETFQIGKRNQLAMKKILWRAGVLVHHEETGGSSSRTVRIDVETGRVTMKMGANPEVQIGSTALNRKGL